MTHNTTHNNIIHLYRGHSESTSLGQEEGVDKEISENEIERRACSQKSDVPNTNSSMFFFL